MALVAYSSSDDDEVEQQYAQRPVKRNTSSKTTNNLPPLPSNFHDLYATSVRASTSDDPALHGGRKRITPHVVGSWPSHVYIEWYPSLAEITVLENIINAVKASHTGLTMHSLLTSELGVPLPLHISLSAALSLTTENKDTFLDVLTKPLKDSRGVTNFTTQLGSPLWAPNHNRSRWFLVLSALPPANDELNSLLRRCNETCEMFALPPLYKAAGGSGEKETVAAAAAPLTERKRGEGKDRDFSDLFHFSIGWTLEEPSDAIKEMANIDKVLLEMARSIVVNVEEVKVKIGNIITSVPLQHNKLEKTRSIID
jgi:hypothetical protein